VRQLGELLLVTPCGNVQLTNVHVPRLSCNLLSVPALMRAGTDVHFSADSLAVRAVTQGEVLFTASLRGALFLVDIAGPERAFSAEHSSAAHEQRAREDATMAPAPRARGLAHMASKGMLHGCS
jgi:hypothetical protein